MPKPTFSWYPDTGAQCAIKPSVQPTKFGDGYELRIAVGINPVSEKWSLKFSRNQAESDAINAFLKARAASESFLWTTPDGMAGTFVCREWRRNRLQGGIAEITCDFEQVFEY